MAVFSQNGFRAKDTSLLATYTIPNTGGIKATLRKGDVSVVMLYLAERYHKEVEPLRKSDTGSYNPRSIVGAPGSSISNHASGTAMDFRWNDHVLGKSGTFTAKEKAALRKILNFLDGVVRWGGDYSGRKDEMHFEINASASRVAAMADKIRKSRSAAQPVKAKPKPTTASTTKVTTATVGLMKKGDKGNDVKSLQRDLNRIFPAYKATPLDVDGDFGPSTEDAVQEFQSRTGLKADGVIGEKTRAMFRRYGISVRG